MIIVKLIGGLGNQLFQYSLGRYLSIKNNTKLKLDISAFANYPDRIYKLSSYNIKAEVAKDIHLLLYAAKHSNPLVNTALLPLRRAGVHLATYYKQSRSGYCDEVEEIVTDAYLAGYWQSYKYFQKIEEEIRGDLALKTILGKKNRQLVKKLFGEQSVAVHIRRGDYITDPQARSYHNILGEEYYKNAISYIKNKVDKSSFYFFSDDIDWVKKNIKPQLPSTYIDWNTKEELDLYLMSKCRHQIIANSSFSWWGAWMNKNKNKMVIAPKGWYKNPHKQKPDMIPNTWMKI